MNESNEETVKVVIKTYNGDVYVKMGSYDVFSLDGLVDTFSKRGIQVNRGRDTLFMRVVKSQWSISEGELSFEIIIE